jgi:superfamily I DNA/RNA helicase
MRLLLALVGQAADSLVLLGGTRQQIYARGSYVRTLGIPIGRRHVRLRVNYRTTEQIREAAARVVLAASALNGESLGVDDTISLLSGPRPTIRAYPSEAEEQQAVIEAIREAMAVTAPAEIAVVARSKSTVSRYHAALLASGVPSDKLDANRSRGSGVQVGTMHRVKGLEFRAVYIVDCSARSVPQTYRGEDDAAARADHEERERHLLYVAMTRPRELLWVSGAGKLSPLVSW